MATLSLTSPLGRRYPLGFNRRIKYTADTDDIPSNSGFIVDMDGTLSVRFREESALDTLAVLGGVVYPGDVAQVDITGSTTVATVWVLQNL